jgi:hypothetical protein
VTYLVGSAICPRSRIGQLTFSFPLLWQALGVGLGEHSLGSVCSALDLLVHQPLLLHADAGPGDRVDAGLLEW